MVVVVEKGAANGGTTSQKAETAVGRICIFVNNRHGGCYGNSHNYGPPQILPIIALPSASDRFDRYRPRRAERQVLLEPQL